MKTCATCKHWGSDEDLSRNDDQHAPKKACARILHYEVKSEYNPSDKAEASDASGYFAWFYAAPDFGCVEHEDKQ